jgi:hypothetical protein
MARRAKEPADDLGDFRGFRWMECYVDTAVNPVTLKQVTFTQPVAIKCVEDFARFNEKWDDFCRNALTGDPDEVHFTLDM